jgi:hypothetical protein
MEKFANDRIELNKKIMDNLHGSSKMKLKKLTQDGECAPWPSVFLCSALQCSVVLQFCVTSLVLLLSSFVLPRLIRVGVRPPASAPWSPKKCFKKQKDGFFAAFKGKLFHLFMLSSPPHLASYPFSLPSRSLFPYFLF